MIAGIISETEVFVLAKNGQEYAGSFFAEAFPVGGEKGGASSLLSETLTGVQQV